MRILHVIPSLSIKHGGPSKALPDMARALSGNGVSVDVATTDDDGPGRRISSAALATPVQHEGFRVFYFRKQTEFYKVSLPLFGWLLRHVKDYDAVHVHGVFSFSTLAAGWSARLRGVPFIVRPLGVLNSWGMANRRRRIKALSFRLVDKPVLDHAACIHYTSRQEQQEAAPLGLCAPAMIIPLGIDMERLAGASSGSEFSTRFPETRNARNLLFMSRLDRKKGIELLLHAMVEVRRLVSDCRLILAGDGDAVYVRELHGLAEDLGLKELITWTGFLQGADKGAALEASVLFVLPSYSENFGIVLLEAMAAGLPCIASDQVALAVEVADTHAIELVACDSAALARAIVAQLRDPDRSQEMGRRAADLARQSYSLRAMAQNLKDMYSQSIQKFSQS